MSDDRIKEWLDRTQAITDAATAGPWEDRRDDLTDWMSVVHDQEFVTFVAETGKGTEKWAVADAEFIAHARTALPQAVAALQAVLDLHQPRTVQGMGSGLVTYRMCRTCSMQEWPCPTITAITETLEEP